VVLWHASEVKGECNGRLSDRGKLGCVVHSSWDHRRRTVGHRPLMDIAVTMIGQGPLVRFVVGPDRLPGMHQSGPLH